MYFDLKAGKKCDVDFVNGVLQRLGKKFGVPTPVNDAVVNLAHEIERGERAISRDNIKLIVKG